jgi:hypothetical protein
VIIERDHVQHLLVLGPTGETLIESGFESGQDAIKRTSDAS